MFCSHSSDNSNALKNEGRNTLKTLYKDVYHTHRNEKEIPANVFFQTYSLFLDNDVIPDGNSEKLARCC